MEKVGFSSEESQIIAYASQFVDDAVDHKEMNVNGRLDILHKRFSEKTFDPICTAHKGLQLLKGLKKEVQNKIYIPFHFLPDLGSIKSNKDSFIVKANCKFAKKIVLSAKTELSKSTGKKRIMNLVRLGISLHTYSDTWTHQDFSGRHNSIENDIDDIEVFKDNKWKQLSFLNKFEYNALPDIGHAEAESFPDQSHLKWRFRKLNTNKIIERNNPEIFLDAAENIFDIFIGLNKNTIWKDVKNKLAECFLIEDNSTDKKFKKFQQVFPEIGFYYDSNQWHNEALKVVEPKNIVNKLKKDKPNYILGSDKKWFYFHLVANEQREYVMNLLQSLKP